MKRERSTLGVLRQVTPLAGSHEIDEISVTQLRFDRAGGFVNEAIARRNYR